MSREFDLVGDLEKSLDDIIDLARVLEMISGTCQISDEGSAVGNLASKILRQALAAEEIREELFSLTHPDPTKRRGPKELENILPDLASADNERVTEADRAICAYEPKTLRELREMAGGVRNSPISTYGGHADALVRGILAVVPA